MDSNAAARRWFTGCREVLVAIAFVVLGAGGVGAAEETSAPVLKNRSIAYALTGWHWAVYASKDGKAECPQGMNDGPRDQFKILHPDDGTKRTLVATQLQSEADIYFPMATPDPFPFKETDGKIAYGLNLDGKIGRNDFTSPDGEQGIDNQMYRVMGCIAGYRGPDGFYYVLINQEMLEERGDNNRLVIELTDVDNLVNDDDVTLTIAHGREKLLRDAAGQDYLAGGTQSIDTQWGRQFVQRFRGKIIDGVLTTDAADWTFPAAMPFSDVSITTMRGARFRLKLTASHAEGLLAGYTDIKSFYRQLIESWSTLSDANGHLAAKSMYRAMARLADGYPDQTTRVNTAISSAVEVKFTQVFVVRQNALLMTPPSTRNAAPVVADAKGLAR